MCLQYTPDDFMKRLANAIADHPVFWLIDGDEDSQWEQCRDLVRNRWRISYVTTVQIPSGDLLRVHEVGERLPLVPIHLLRLSS
jgi:hypothetical protein